MIERLRTRAGRRRCSSPCGRSSTRTSSRTDDDGNVLAVEDMSTLERVGSTAASSSSKREILDWIEPGDELVEETFARLIEAG